MKRALASLGVLFWVVASSNAHGLGERAGLIAGLSGSGFERTAISCPQEFDDIFGRPTQSKLKMDAAGLRSLTRINLALLAYPSATVDAKRDRRLVGESVFLGLGTVRKAFVNPRRFHPRISGPYWKS